MSKDFIENHTHRLVDKPTKQDIYLREESIFIQGYRQSEKQIAELEQKVENQKSFLKRIRAKFNLGELERKEIEEYLDGEQLNKAKALLKEWIVCHGGTREFHSALQDKTEEFLKEVEE